MADICMISKNRKYQTLQKVSGVSGFNLDYAVAHVSQDLQREPQLDDINGANSEPYIVKELKLNHQDGKYYRNTKELFQQLGVSTIQEANSKLNNQYRDLEISITDFYGVAIVNIEHRPTEFTLEFEEELEIDPRVSTTRNAAVLKHMSDKLGKLYGVVYHVVDTATLSDMGIAQEVPNSALAAGFIYNGEIYINTDIASIDTPIHELQHLILGALKFQNPELYITLTQSMEALPNYAQLASEFKYRTRNDVNEEIYIDNISKALVGKSSALDSLPIGIKNEIIYQAQRTLDSALFGKYSVKAIDQNRLFKYSLNELAHFVRSTATSIESVDYGELARLNRLVANTKERLLESGELTEICE